MYIEVVGASSLNKGAYLMLLSLLDQIEERGLKNKIKLVVAPSHGFSYKDRSVLGLYQKLWFEKKGYQFGYILDFLCPKLLKIAYGLVGDREISAVLDISGFYYGDYWGESTVKSASRRVRKSNKKYILLPQAFGPFENLAVKKYAADFLRNAVLVYSRDQESYEHCKKIGVSSFLCPDLTILNGIDVSPNISHRNGVAIVPNYKMLESSNSKFYIEALKGYIGICLKNSIRVDFIIHEGVKDYKIAQALNEELCVDIPILMVDSPVRIKEMLSSYKVVISSRFHALVSSLSKVTPVISLGWSHKYSALLADFGVADYHVDLNEGLKADDIARFNRLLLDDEIYSKVSTKIRSRLLINKDSVSSMWDTVFKQLDEL